jgi:hypothetical protein
MDLHFLCLGSGMLNSKGGPVDTCPMGQTCIAGDCKDNGVQSSTLADYGNGTNAFGNGSCFDGASCWASPTVADLDTSTCTLPPAKNVNVALQTEGIGICGPAGCFVTLDANSPEGWTVGKDGRIDLPPAVCRQLAPKGKIVNVVTSPVTSACQEKSTQLPTCGPWSSAKNNAPPYKGPLALAGGQPRPTSLAVDQLGELYWINAGLTGGTDGTVKMVGPLGGTPTALADMNQSPRDVVVVPVGVNQVPTVIWSSATPASTGTIWTFASGDNSPKQPYTGLSSPEGVAVYGTNPNSPLFWTDFQTGKIFMGSIDGTASMNAIVSNANYPYRIAADQDYVYWTDEGTTGTMPPDGAVELFGWSPGTTASDKISGVLTPRAIAIEPGPNNDAAAVWYATFDMNGSLYRAPVSAGKFGTPVVMASALGFPNGIAIDANKVYWTNGDGTVQSLPLGAAAGTPPDTLATQQLAPGNIAVDDMYVYWVNEGTSTNPSGGVLKLPKP